MKKTLLSIALILSLGSIACADNAFLLLSADPIQAAMGGAGTAIQSRGNYSLNPASTAWMGRPELRTSLMTGIGDLKLAVVFAGIPIKHGVMGVSFHSLYSAPEDETIGGISTGSLLKYSDTWYGFHYGMKLKSDIRIGASLKYIHKVLADTSASAFAADAGVSAGFRILYFSSKNKDRPNLELGMVAGNVGTSTRFVSESESLPFTVRSGMSYKPYNFMTAAYDVEWVMNPSEVRHHAGLEFVVFDLLALRGGVSVGASGTELSTGAGVVVPVGTRSISVDYSMTPSNSGGLSHFISVKAMF